MESYLSDPTDKPVALMEARHIRAVTGQLLEFHRTGKLRILAVTSPTRLVAAPEIPTAVEAGLPGMVSQQLIGLFAPAGTSKVIIAQVGQATRTALAEPAYQQMLVESGFEPDVDSNSEKFRRLINEDICQVGTASKSDRLENRLKHRKCSRRPISQYVAFFRSCRYCDLE